MKITDHKSVFEKIIKESENCQNILDSVTLYFHITTKEKDNPHCRVEISNSPYTMPNWKDCTHVVEVGYSGTTDHEAISCDTFRKCSQLIAQLSYIMTIKGHEVYACWEKNPDDKIGSYDHISKQINTSIASAKKELGKL